MSVIYVLFLFFFFQAEDGIRDGHVTGVQTCALPISSTGTWYVRGLFTVTYGASGDIPAPADYNGDGRADMSVFRPSTGTWYVRGGTAIRMGGRGDRPVPADYDGDGRAEQALFRPSTGYWY